MTGHQGRSKSSLTGALSHDYFMLGLMRIMHFKPNCSTSKALYTELAQTNSWLRHVFHLNLSIRPRTPLQTMLSAPRPTVVVCATRKLDRAH